MADAKYNTYEKLLNLKIKEYKESGVSAQVRQRKNSVGVILTCANLDKNGDPQFIPGRLAGELKSVYNLIKRKNVEKLDIEIMEEAVSEIYNSYKSWYAQHQKDTSGEPTVYLYNAAVGSYYSVLVLRDFIKESFESLGGISLFKDIDSFVVNEASRVENLKSEYIKYSLKSERDLQKSESNDEMLKFAGGAFGLGIVLIIVVGFIKLASGVVGSSSYSGSGYSSQSSGGSMTINGESYTQQQFEDKLRGEAERLYDNCQAFGSGFSDKCP